MYKHSSNLYGPRHVLPLPLPSPVIPISFYGTLYGQDCDWAFHRMPPSSCRQWRQTFLALHQGWRVLHASVSPAYQAALTHITWLSLNILEWEFSSLFLWNKLNARTWTCRKTSRDVSVILLILTVIYKRSLTQFLWTPGSSLIWPTCVFLV